MPAEPATKRAIVFVDGQNLFYAIKYAFGYTWPNYDVTALEQAICSSRGWTLSRVHFYTGIPSIDDDPFWNHFWTSKLAGAMALAPHAAHHLGTIRLMAKLIGD